jgi:HAD superfamily hydrolase (TIGR01509 family)
MVFHDMELVIFDCDGVLVDSETLAAEAFSQLAKDAGLLVTPSEAYQRFQGKKVSSCLAEIKALGGNDLPKDAEHRFRLLCEQIFEKRLKPVPGIHSLLRRLPLPYCVASSAPRKKINKVLGLARLQDCFPQERIFSAYEVGHWKPDPRIFLYTAEKLEVSPQRCLVIEDSEVGVQAAEAAGMQVIQYQASSPFSSQSFCSNRINSMDELFP